MQADPPFNTVVHTGSPFHYQVNDNKKDMVDPAVIWTTAILKAIKMRAPSVKRVAVTSSFAATSNPKNPPLVYSEDIWNEMAMDEALTTADAQAACGASKTFAKQASLGFVKTQSSNFTLTVLNPLMVYGPVRHPVTSLEDLNTTSKRILNTMQGKRRHGPIGSPPHVDVRDLALAQALAVKMPEAASQRIFLSAAIATRKRRAALSAKPFQNLPNRYRMIW